MKKLSNKFFVIKLLLILIFASFNLHGITYDNIEVSEQYGKLTSHEQACGIARDSLFDKARRMASGYETISSESTNICKFSDQESKCDLFSSSFHSIAKVQIVDYEFLKFADGSKCRFSSAGNNVFEATVKANITLKKLPPPPDNFNFKISLNTNQFISYPTNKIKLRKNNDKLNITIETTEDMYVYVFQWWPYEDNNSIIKIFPNENDKVNFFNSKVKHTIPTSQSLRKYALRVDFPNEEYVLDNDVQEFLMIIGTKEKVVFFDEYKFTEFGQKLANIQDFVQERKSYLIRKKVD
jgi:hypothetical protein